MMKVAERATLLSIALIGLSLGPGTPPASAQSGVLTHLVQPGDSLLDIELFYGIQLHELSAANAVELSPRGLVGAELSVPVAFEVVAVAEGALEAAGTSSPTYIVQRGDTLFRIATRFNVSMDALAAANQIVWVDRIFVGQVLQIPDEDFIPPASEAAALEPLPAEAIPQPTVLEGKQIIVVLSQQRVYAFEDGSLLRHFLASTGLPGTPTVQGDFAVYSKLASQRMTGPGYDLPGVPWVMYFFRGYALHGTYWHNNFGTPMSHGCVNLRTPEAEWLYQWAPIGTPVRVIY
jgi:LysM repeat protein